jgi:hypothetical protein
MPVRHALSAKHGLPPLGLALATDWDERFDQSPQPVRREFDGHWTTPIRKDVPTLSTGCWRNEVYLESHTRERYAETASTLTRWRTRRRCWERGGPKSPGTAAMFLN